MSKLNQLRGDSGKVKIDKIEIEIKPLSFKEFTRAMELYDEKKNIEAMEYLLFATMKKSVMEEGETEDNLKEEIAEMPPRHAIKILEEIQKVNGLDGSSNNELEKKDE